MGKQYLKSMILFYSKIKSIKSVYIIQQASNNQLNQFRQVEQQLQNKTKLTTVYFEGNPLETDARAVYRRKIRVLLPQLKQIDAVLVR